MRATLFSIVAGCAMMLCFASQLHAQLIVEITRGVQRPVPMAIVPFGWQGPAGSSAPYDLAAVITADLASSGRFGPIPVENMLTRPTVPSEVNYSDWRILNVDLVVIGQLTETAPGRYTAVFQLFDILRGEQVLAFRLTSGLEDLRATAHRISDMIFEELTGIPGIFSTRIAYITETRGDGDTRIYRLIVSDADGENAQVVTESTQPLMSPAWSPDGRSLAYVSFEENRSQIFIQTLRTGSRRVVSGRDGVNGAPVFSPDGRTLALTLSRDGNLDIYTLNLTNQVLIQVTRENAMDTEPTWSPDGEYIYFMSDRVGRPQIYRVRPEAGARAERVTYEGRYNSRPRLSPDGEDLAVVYQDGEDYRIAMVDPATGLLRQVLTQGSLDESPSFAPNGDTIIYATRKAGQGVLATVSADGRIEREIASVAGDVREPVWSPYPRP